MGFDIHRFRQGACQKHFAFFQFDIVAMQRFRKSDHCFQRIPEHGTAVPFINTDAVFEYFHPLGR
jgi:hypothetical protein